MTESTNRSTNATTASGPERTATVLLEGIAMGESARWRNGRFWFADWGAEELVAVDESGAREVVAEVHSLPFCFDWLPDGRLVVVASADRALVVRTSDGSFESLADLRPISDRPWNEVVVDGRGNAYVNGIGFEMGEEEPAPGHIALVTPDGTARQVAGDLAFPNGMALTPNGRTLIVAESYGSCLTAFDVEPDGVLANRRVWADLGDDNPDGICLDADGAVWYASVPGERCVRVREGGEVLQTVRVDRGCFSCALGGAEASTLFIVANRWPDVMDPDAPRSGQVLTAQAPSPAAARPA